MYVKCILIWYTFKWYFDKVKKVHSNCSSIPPKILRLIFVLNNTS